MNHVNCEQLCGATSKNDAVFLQLIEAELAEFEASEIKHLEEEFEAKTSFRLSEKGV